MQKLTSLLHQDFLFFLIFRINDLSKGSTSAHQRGFLPSKPGDGPNLPYHFLSPCDSFTERRPRLHWKENPCPSHFIMLISFSTFSFMKDFQFSRSGFYLPIPFSFLVFVFFPFIFFGDCRSLFLSFRYFLYFRLTLNSPFFSRKCSNLWMAKSLRQSLQSKSSEKYSSLSFVFE